MCYIADEPSTSYPDTVASNSSAKLTEGYGSDFVPDKLAVEHRGEVNYQQRHEGRVSTSVSSDVATHLPGPAPEAKDVAEKQNKSDRHTDSPDLVERVERIERKGTNFAFLVVQSSLLYIK